MVSGFMYDKIKGRVETVIDEGVMDAVECSGVLCPLFMCAPNVDSDDCIQGQCAMWSSSRRCCGLIATVK
jgi:hypothetical protein